MHFPFNAVLIAQTSPFCMQYGGKGTLEPDLQQAAVDQFWLLIQVQDMNLLHTLVAGCLSYQEWLERRDMLVSTIIVQHAEQTDTASRLYSKINCCRTKPVFSTATLASQLCWELDLLIISWSLWLWRTDWRPDMLFNCCRCGVTAGSHRACHADCQTMPSVG